MARIRFVLGAGKTTAIARLARHYLQQGHQVGIVTNDQAHGLVDTETLRGLGFDVGEVPGACFCCKFDDLIDTINQLEQSAHPDVVITEPVGSCTDLVATVIEPLRQLHGGKYDIAPLTVLLKPEHGLKILRAEARVGFSQEAAYIFLKQIEEADIVAINKIDKLEPPERDELLSLVEEHYPGKPAMLVSAKTGEGFADLITLIEQSSPKHVRFMPVDYDRYARGEAELGWLNATYRAQAVDGDRTIPMDELALELARDIRQRLVVKDLEPAHLKILCQGDHAYAIANVVDSDGPADLSLRSNRAAAEVQIVVNARIAADPATIEQVMAQALEGESDRLGFDYQQVRMEAFRPMPPTPTHRIGSDEQS